MSITTLLLQLVVVEKNSKCHQRLNSKTLMPHTKVFKDSWWIMIWIASGSNTSIKYSTPFTTWTSKSIWSPSSRSHSTLSLSLYKKEKVLLGVWQLTSPNLVSEMAAKLMVSSISLGATLQACYQASTTAFLAFWGLSHLLVTWTWSKGSCLAVQYRRVNLKNRRGYLNRSRLLLWLNKSLKRKKIILWKLIKGTILLLVRITN